MNIKSLYLAMPLCMSMIVGLCPNVAAQKEAEVNIRVVEPPARPTPPPPTCADVNPKFADQLKGQLPASEIVELFYLRNAKTLKEILATIAKANNLCLGGIVISSQGDNSILLYGKEAQRDFLKRVIAMLDLRLEGVDMSMWGILISSDNPGELAGAMREINREITRTRDLLRETYLAFEDRARAIEIDPQYERILQQLGYPRALDRNRLSLSMTDILLRISAAKDPDNNYKAIAQNLCKIFEEDDKEEKYAYYVEELQRSGKRPFSNYFKEVMPGLKSGKSAQCKDDRYDPSYYEVARSLRRRKAVLDFALNYAHFVQKPDEFDPRELQKSAENLNSVLNPIVDAINRDVDELFMQPTLKRIQEIVGHFGDVSYAEVGRTKVMGLNGLPSSVTSETVSAFDETGPLRLNELLQTAGELNEFSKDLFPTFVPSEVQGATSVQELGIGVPTFVSLAAALSADRSVFRSLTSGVSLSITPSVLRNSTSAELDINLTTGPQETEVPDANQNLKPLSRIKQNKVETTVYVETLDLFPLSTFNNQTTIDGGRTYIPVIGTIWKGIFSGVPIFGELFSWRNHPKSVQHQSIVLTNSFIVPTAMGLAPLYDNDTGRTTDLFSGCQAVDSYFFEQQRRLDELRQEQERTFLNPDSSEEQVFGQSPSFGSPSPFIGSPSSECDRFRTNPL